MKFVKCIGLFFIYPLMFLLIGFYAGVRTYQFFYPQYPSGIAGAADTPSAIVDADLSQAAGEGPGDGAESERDARYVSSASETLYVGTEYVLEETDVVHHTLVETTWRLPDKYVGMNREQFLAALEIYEAAPPLSEQERGFVGLEVLSFSRERVVVQMNYRYIEPSESFYLAAFDNEVVVYLDDRETVYIETQIRLDSLPEDIQQKIIQMMHVENEEELYGFLETYSS